MKNKLLPMIGVLAVLVIIFIVGTSIYKKSERDRLGFLAQENAKLFAPEYAPTFGSDNAKVIITEFLDPECESCRRFYPKVKELLKMYEGEVKLVVRYVAFHKNSAHAIRVLEATRKQNKYAESLALLFEYQPAWASHHAPQPELVFTYLPEVGVDIAKLKIDMQDASIEKNMAQDAKDATELNVRGTPTFFVNGKPLQEFGLGNLYSAIAKEVEIYYPKK